MNPTNLLKYSFNTGSSWKEVKLPVKLHVEALDSLPHATSQQFVLVGVLDQNDRDGAKLHAVVHVPPMLMRECTGYNMETFRLRTSKGKDCVMGHKQSYRRKKPDVECYMGKQFEDPIEHGQLSDCSDDDYECDYNYVRNGGMCEPMRPEPIPVDACLPDLLKTYMGSSGWWLIPGNACKTG